LAGVVDEVEFVQDDGMVVEQRFDLVDQVGGMDTVGCVPAGQWFVEAGDGFVSCIVRGS